MSLKFFFLILLMATKAFAQGTILWNESVNGSLSHDFTSPTTLPVLVAGTNTIIGATELQPTPPNYAAYPDYFLISVPAGTSLSGIFLQIDKPNVWTWIGDANYLNVLSYSMDPSSGSLLPQLSLSSIDAGTYGMYLLNNDAQPVLSIAHYRLDFFVQSIPEPDTLSLALVGLGVVGIRRWKRIRRHQK